jgi:ribonuclease-3 family protein
MENLFEICMTPEQVKGITNLGLAHIGDGVYELLCRSYLCASGHQTLKRLHADSVSMVKAPTQAKYADLLLPHLTEEEQDYYRRGKNAHTHAAPKSASRQEYAKATGLETLFGALYLAGKTDRLNELFHLIVEAEHGI